MVSCVVYNVLVVIDQDRITRHSFRGEREEAGVFSPIPSEPFLSLFSPHNSNRGRNTFAASRHVFWALNT